MNKQNKNLILRNLKETPEMSLFAVALRDALIESTRLKCHSLCSRGCSELSTVVLTLYIRCYLRQHT